VSDAIIEIESVEPQPSPEVWPPPRTEAAVSAAQVEEATADPARFYDDDYRTTLAAMVASELASAGPLRQDRLVQRIARIHGFQRAGREIQERVVASITEACRRTRDTVGTFVWPINADPAGCETFRPLATGDTRDPSEVPIEELTVLAKACLQKHQDEEIVLIAMRDACGLLKLREASRDRFREALKRVGNDRH
jgi:hypothetical protein